MELWSGRNYGVKVEWVELLSEGRVGGAQVVWALMTPQFTSKCFQLYDFICSSKAVLTVEGN